MCYYANHINESTFLDLCALVIFSNFFKTLPGGERGEERGGENLSKIGEILPVFDENTLLQWSPTSTPYEVD